LEEENVQGLQELFFLNLAPLLYLNQAYTLSVECQFESYHSPRCK